MRAVEKRSGGWYVVELPAGLVDGYSTTSAAAKRRRIPVSMSAPREQAVTVARRMGMLDDKEDNKG